MKPERLHLIYPYYKNPGMLSIQLAHWQSYPADLKKKCQFVIIDDGSPKHPALDVIGKKPGLNLHLYRVKENIAWNQHGCRNLGAKVTKGKWLFISDMDMVLDAENAAKIFDADLYETAFYKVGRVKMPDWEPKNQHCNTLLLTRDQYWSDGGYDEDYCGTYGGDGPFVKYLDARYKFISLDKIVVKYYGRTYIQDSGTNDFDRDGELRAKYHAVSARKKEAGEFLAKNPIRFEWERLL